MNADAFLSAQLWLRRLPAQAWPKSTTAAPATAVGGGKAQHGSCRDAFAAKDGAHAPTDPSIGNAPGLQEGSRVVLGHASCCFVLEDRPSAGAAAGRSDDSLGRAPGVAVTAGSAESGTAVNATADRGGANAVSRRRPRPLYFSTSNGTNGVNGGSAQPEEAAREDRAGKTGKTGGCENGESVSCAGFQENSGTAGVAGSRQLDGRSTATAAPVEEPAPVAPRHEFDFGLAIARGSTPPNEAVPDGGGGARRSEAEKGGALLLRIAGKVYEAEHTLIRSIAYPRGGAGTGRGSRGDDAGSGGVRGDVLPGQAPTGAETGTPRPTVARNDEHADPNRGRGDGDVGRRQGGPSPTPGEVDAVPSKHSPPAESTAAGPRVARGKRKIDACTLNRTSEVSCERHKGGGNRVCFHGKPGGAVGVGGGATDAAAAAAAQARKHSEGGEGAEPGVPFCGLFFPGVLLKFWLPSLDGECRMEAVARLQGVVNAMLAGLSSTPRCERQTSSGGEASQELDGLVSSVIAEGQATGFRLRYEAWDEFAHGSHFLVQQERCRPQRGCRRPQPASYQPQRGGAEGPALRPSSSRSSAWVGIDAPALSGLPASGDSDSFLGGGIISDVGRARALTSLAGCFSQASLPLPVRLAAQRRLRAAATSASRDLECALDEAFPLDLSQETDSNTRVSTVSELEASLRRVQQTRKSLLAISILPASDALDDWEGGPC